MSEIPKKPRKAIALLSGGLDSTLAAKIVKDQGIDVIGVHLLSPFACKTDIEKCAESIGIPLIMKEKGEAYLDLVEKPKFGYGKAMNPCIDCRIFMFQLADKMMPELGADFVVTGEVLGQRPMSQVRHSLELIDNNSTLKGRVVRPLSALQLEPSIPEQEGWVDRNAFFEISGRGRKDQIALAEKLGLKVFAPPGGGCLLTETGFSNKLKDWINHPEYEGSEDRLAQGELLRLGRHFRLREDLKVVLGRDHAENAQLDSRWKVAKGTLFAPDNFIGPSAIAFGEVDDASRELVAQLILRYSKAPPGGAWTVKYQKPDGDAGNVAVQTVVTDQQLETWRI